MYTSGWPKYQNRCCHRIGEPPSWSSTCSPATTRPPGMKKLVPALRSSSSRTPAPNRTGNDRSASTAVVNQAQQVSGMRISDMPLLRNPSVVAMKFKAPSSEPTQKIAMLMIHRFMPAP